MTDTDDEDAKPREHELPNGSLAVSSHWVWGVRDATTVPAGDKPLYRLLRRLLDDTGVPDVMPAYLAAACDDLVDVKRAVENIDRGRADVGGVGWGMSYCYRVRDAIEEHRDRPPMRLVAVGCSGTKDKSPGELPAKDRYRGGYWTNKREYAETYGAEWRVISAEHAVLNPSTPIEYYERTPGDLEGVPVDSNDRLPSGDPVTTLLDQWALDVYEGLAGWLALAAGGIDPRDVVLEVLLGETRYAEPLRDRGVFDALRGPAGIEIRFPFRDIDQARGGIGNQRSWMSDRVEAAEASS